MANVKQTQKMIPFITCEISLGQYVCELVFGVDALDLDSEVVRQLTKRNSVGPGNMSHCGTSAFKNHLNHCFVVFKIHTTRLHDLKNGHLREYNQHFPNH